VYCAVAVVVVGEVGEVDEVAGVGVMEVDKATGP
jgi:hypothetical protein